MADIKCAGIGGQGVLTAGLLLAHVAMDNGFEVSWTPLYTSEMRGGSAVCDVRIARESILCPYVKHMDVLIALNRQAVLQCEQDLIPGGVLVANASLMSDEHEYRRDVTVVPVSAMDLARRADNPRGMNIIMLSAGIAAARLFDRDAFISGISRYFSKKGHAAPQNIACAEIGFDAGSAGRAA